MDAILFTIGTIGITVQNAVVAGFVLAFLILVLLTAQTRKAAALARHELQADERSRALETALSEVTRTQAEMSGRMQTMAEIFGERQSDMGRALGERLDGLGHRLGQSVADTTKHTTDNLRQLHERIGVIDRAQKTIADLSGQVHDLSRILSDKQSRGAFGQGRMEAIIQDGLPVGGYTFQPVLSNNTRPDCVIAMPNGAPGLVIDAKFPLEAFKKVQDSLSEEDTRQANQQFKRDIAKHVLDIRDRYLLPGETQDTAFMFVPSESIFAELHEFHDDLVQKAHRARVVIVSPALLMLSVQVVQALLKDARMREEAHVIQAEVGHLMDDINRLSDRVINLQKHFAQASRDVEQVLVSSEKIARRGYRIENMEFDEASAGPEVNREARVADATAPEEIAPEEIVPEEIVPGAIVSEAIGPDESEPESIELDRSPDVVPLTPRRKERGDGS